MKLFTILVLLILYVQGIHAQNRVLDSLNTVIRNAKSDTARIRNAALKISKLNEVNIDSAILLARNLKQEAKKINYQQGEADILDESSSYSLKGNYDTALNSLQEAEKIAFSLKDSSRIAMLYASYGMMYGIKGMYDSSIQFYEKAIGIDERHGNIKRLSSEYGNLAIGYQMLSNFPEALQYQQKALKLAEEKGDISAQAYTLMNLGNTYQNIGDTSKSETAILKGIELAKNIGIRNVELYGYSNLATLYNIQKKYEQS